MIENGLPGQETMTGIQYVTDGKGPKVAVHQERQVLT